MAQQNNANQAQTSGPQRQQSSQSGPIQGIIQISILGQLPNHLLPQVHRRLRNHSEHEADFELNEDVLLRGMFRIAPAVS